MVPYYWEALDRNAGEWKCWHVRVCVFTFSLLTYPARKSSFIRNRFLGAERSLYATHTVVSAYDRYICTLCNCETEELCSLGCYLPSIKLQLRARQGASHRSTIVISRKSFSFTLFSLACFFIFSTRTRQKQFHRGEGDHLVTVASNSKLPLEDEVTDGSTQQIHLLRIYTAQIHAPCRTSFLRASHGHQTQQKCRERTHEPRRGRDGRTTRSRKTHDASLSISRKHGGRNMKPSGTRLSPRRIHTRRPTPNACTHIPASTAWQTRPGRRVRTRS